MYSVNRILDRYVRETEAKMLSDLLTERELKGVQRATVARVARRAESNTIIQKRDIIYSYEARSKIAARKKTKVEKT